jgi:hypothetical protein
LQQKKKKAESLKDRSWRFFFWRKRLSFGKENFLTLENFFKSLRIAITKKRITLQLDFCFLAILWAYINYEERKIAVCLKIIIF